jgi:hypothetical protein
MKKIFILGLLFLNALLCNAQLVVPVETKESYLNSETGIPENIAYFKDINQVFNKFVGTWKGSYNGLDYEFIMKKYTKSYDGLTQDILIVRYCITKTVRTAFQTKTTTIIDTRSEPDTSASLLRGSHFQKKKTYLLDYYGKESRCGQSGTVFIEIINASNTQMKLFLSPTIDMISQKECPNGEATQILPLKSMLLIKQ